MLMPFVVTPESPPRLCPLCCRDPPATETYTLSLHDALPILPRKRQPTFGLPRGSTLPFTKSRLVTSGPRSEEHTSELQSHHDLVCRLLLAKKNIILPSDPRI